MLCRGEIHSSVSRFGVTLSSILLACALLPPECWSAQPDSDGAEQLIAAKTTAADHAVVEALLRIPGATLRQYPDQQDAVARHLGRIAGKDSSAYVRIARRLGAANNPEMLLRIASNASSGQAGIDAIKLLFGKGHAAAVQQHFEDLEDEAKAALLTNAGFSGQKAAVGLLMPIMTGDAESKPVRSAAANALGKHWHGQQKLLEIARNSAIPESVRFEVTNSLLGSSNPKVANAAKQIESLKPIATGKREALPPTSQLAKMKGDPSLGKQIFAKEGTCANCHKVKGEGKEVGPDLSEIGSKLSKEDMFVAILNPSAGISHNYETYSCLTADGQLITGILINETDESVTLKTADAVLRTVADDDIEVLRKQEVSLMPADLQKQMTVQQLSDLVDYLTLLKKPQEKRFNSVAKQSGPVSREASDAISGFDIGDGLTVQLLASEPLMLSPTSIDVDHLGRIWVCEAVNYRHFRNHDNEPRVEGDRILVMEDTDQDAIIDKTTVFHQGTDIDSPHGVCVLGDRVIVSAGENVMVFRDTDGDLKADEKSLMFTGISGVQHDHGIHSFMPGPDGKLYFNFGNEGKQLLDAEGKPVVDLAGNVVNDSRQPYQQGMVFRCDLDGSNVETLGWNFRNNWEVVVDSFGAMWQSDNDDDGNRGTRINYVMEYGNYGYRNQKTGDYWRSERIGMRDEIGERHWHLNDPGVIPNLLQTGAGSPTGITIYEGDLLPQRFQNQVIHTDPGPNVVRAYPVTDAGAGYSAEIDNMIVGVRDQWFRPVDVCEAPDGSLIIADWYDPGVGGHRMGDTTRGRLFRITVPGHEAYTSAAPDFTTLESASRALQSPNRATRFLAGQAIKKFWQSSQPNVDQLLDPKKVPDPRMRARWMWLMAKTPTVEEAAIKTAMKDSDANMRMAAIRAARQSDMIDELDVAEQLINDPSPQVRRELAVALRGKSSDRAVELWTQLAIQYDGQDRWYLEAIGLSADLNWDACFAAWLKKVGEEWNSSTNRDIVWRSRSSQSAEHLSKLILASDSPDEQERYFRALEFFDPQVQQDAMSMIVMGIR